MASLFDDKEKYKNAIMSNWDATHILCHMEDLMQIFCNICNHKTFRPRYPKQPQPSQDKYMGA